MAAGAAAMDGLDDAGAVVTGGLAAQAVDGHGARHAASSVGQHGHGDHGAGGTCPNCGATRAGAFCQNCGQAAHIHRDMMGFAHDVVHGVFHFDGKFWTTLPMLALRPGQLTRRYIDGERQKFVTPMAMFLFSVFLMFAIVSNIGFMSGVGGKSGALAGVTKDLATARRQVVDETVRTRTEIAELEAARARRVAAGQDVAAADQRLAKLREDLRGLSIAAAAIPGEGSPKVEAAAAGRPKPSQAEIKGWFEQRVEHFRENPKLAFYKMKTAGYKYSWALIPLSLPFLWVMFAWRRRFGLYDHAVFATYSIAFMSLLVVVSTLAAAWLGKPAIMWFALLLIPPVHMYKQLRYGYLLSRLSAAWRTVVLLGVVTVTSTLFFLWLLYLGVAD
ncbi:DUF3667 domain-containing protein [Sphingomonas arantia]|uniref:DUF3667 domain-containing protein n=2 Tax=Sphingomonas arantia TaxID=1460676 RepID=A0ABW4U2H9_9SPHN